MAKVAQRDDHLLHLAVLLAGNVVAATAGVNAARSSEASVITASTAATAFMDRPTFLREDRHRVLFGHLFELPNEQRQVLVLRYFADHTDREIATLLRMPRAEVASHAQRALAKLRSTAIPSRDRSPRDPQTLLLELRDETTWDLPFEPQPATPTARRRRWFVAIPAAAVVAAVAVAALVVAPLVTPESSEAESPTITLSAEITDNGELAVNDRGITVSEFPRLEEAPLAGNASTPWAVLESTPGVANLRIVYVSPAEPASTCGAPLGVNVVETTETVTIAAVSSPAAPTGDCTTNARYAGGIVYLSKAIGDRQLVHAGLSAPWDGLVNPIATAPRPVEETPEPVVYQDKIYLTSEGMGDLRLGERVPSDTELVRHVVGGEACAQWVAALSVANDDADARAFRIATRQAKADGPIETISIESPDVPTKSGARVGDSLESLIERYPDIGNPVSSPDGSIIFVIPGNVGKVLFVVYDDAVVLLQLVPIDAAVPYNGEGTGCGGA